MLHQYWDAECFFLIFSVSLLRWGFSVVVTCFGCGTYYCWDLRSDWANCRFWINYLRCVRAHWEVLLIRGLFLSLLLVQSYVVVTYFWFVVKWKYSLRGQRLRRMMLFFPLLGGRSWTLKLSILGWLLNCAASCQYILIWPSYAQTSLCQALFPSTYQPEV